MFSRAPRLPQAIGNIEIKNVSFAYPKRPDAQVLSNVSMSIAAGTTVALVGESGSGKSTIVQVCMTLVFLGMRLRSYKTLVIRSSRDALHIT